MYLLFALDLLKRNPSVLVFCCRLGFFFSMLRRLRLISGWVSFFLDARFSDFSYRCSSYRLLFFFLVRLLPLF
jgi:hypothetical protein